MEQVPQTYRDELHKAHGNITGTLAVLHAVEQEQFIPLEHLLESLRSMSTAIPESQEEHVEGYIFASGNINRFTGLEYKKYTAALVQGEYNFATIADTQAAQFVAQGRFEYEIAKTLKATNSPLRASEVMHGYIKPDGKREPGLWDEMSQGYAQNAKGHVVTITPNSQAHRVFVQSELPALIANDNITSINGLPIELFTDYFDALKQAKTPDDEIYSMIDRDLVQGSSIEFMSGLHPDFEQDLGVVLRQSFDRQTFPELAEILSDATPDMLSAPSPGLPQDKAHDPIVEELHH